MKTKYKIIVSIFCVLWIQQLVRAEVNMVSESKISHWMVYTYENDTLNQTVAINFITNKTAKVELTSINKKREQLASMKGECTWIKKSKYANSDIIQDSITNIIYTLKDQKCYGEIHLDKHKNQVQIIMDGTQEHEFCPLSSVFMLKKISGPFSWNGGGGVAYQNYLSKHLRLSD